MFKTIAMCSQPFRYQTVLSVEAGTETTKEKCEILQTDPIECVMCVRGFAVCMQMIWSTQKIYTRFIACEFHAGLVAAASSK